MSNNRGTRLDRPARLTPTNVNLRLVEELDYEMENGRARRGSARLRGFLQGIIFILTFAFWGMVLRAVMVAWRDGWLQNLLRH